MKITKEQMKKREEFFILSQTIFDVINKKIKNLNSKRASQDTDVPARIVKENFDIIVGLLFSNYDDAVINYNFISCSKKC